MTTTTGGPMASGSGPPARDDLGDERSTISTSGTPAAAGAMIRARRTARGWSQQALADAAGVSRKFLIDLEAGHDRAELGKTLAVLTALGLSLAATDPLPRGRGHDPERRDCGATFTQLIAEKDFEFAAKMLADYAAASLKAGRPLLQRRPRLKDRPWSAALAGITAYTARRLGQPAPSWARRTKPLGEAWMPAESYRRVRAPMKEPTRSETPPGLAAMNVLIRERSLAAMNGGEPTAEQIRALLHEPGRHLAAQGVHGDIKLVGGAALILQGIGNHPTADIDASYANRDTVNAVVAGMASDYDLAPDWFNSNAAAFVPDNATWIDLEHLDGLTIQAADTETLLAMKIAAERDKDTLDIARLLRKPSITNAADAVNLAYNKYGEHSIPLAAGRENYLIVVDDALDAAATLTPEADH
ncbi:helix-turn-helix domain-containing protein [Pseudarthrobacter sp. P1]|uniref:helix-turn-helix domain-containing protein n=1 Tax=Pseudarthrobacter sp. P1 TaxID=3418418 RepID=UPI003CE6C542